MKNFRNREINFNGFSGIPPSIEEVETTIPAFIGYTEKAARKGTDDLLMVPTKINSLREFENIFGLPYVSEIEVEASRNSSNVLSITRCTETEIKYMLYYSIRLFFENGGGPCYIVSVDTYRHPQRIVLRCNGWSHRFGLLDGLNQIAEVDDISLVVIPEAVKLSAPDYSILVQAVLAQCHQLENRFAIFDLRDGDSCTPDLNFDRALFGNKYLKNGGAYYPFLTTTMCNYINSEESNVKVTYEGEVTNLGCLKNRSLLLYKLIKTELNNHFLNLPACGAVAATYFTTDKTRGVWKSPVNRKLSCVKRPLVSVGNQLLDELSMDTASGKSINTIRTFQGNSYSVFGARTLEGNDEGGKYIPVRRFIIMVRESLRKATSRMVYEPNNSSTWTKICVMIENYLTQKWQEGALAGVTPHASFFVNCGIDTTMTVRDVTEGRMNIQVGLAVLRPGEFFVLQISQQQMTHKRKPVFDSESIMQ